MQRVLSIDASNHEVQALLLEVEKSPDPDSLRLKQSVRIVPEDQESIGQAIIRAGLQIQEDWNDTVLFLHSPATIAMNVTVPFSEDKHIKKIIESEVQDQVPFDTDQFALSYKYIGSLNGTGQVNDVHVALCPALTISNILSELKGTKFEPRIISTPTSGLEGLYNLFPNELETNATLCVFTKDTIYLGFIIEKKLVAERSLKINLVNEQIWQSIETAIRSIEARYNQSLNVLYRIIEAKNLNQTNYLPPTSFGRIIKDLSLANLFPHLSEKVSLLALAGSIFGKEYPYQKTLTNFRTAKFSYRPSIVPLFSSLKSLSTYFLVAFTAIVFLFLGSYTIRQFKINSLQKELYQSISSVVPGFVSAKGQEAITLQNLTQGIQDSLKELGSALVASPLSVLAVSSEEINRIEEIKISRWSVRNNEVKIDGTAPNYRALNRLESAFKKRKNIFCKIKTDSHSIGGNRNTRDFQISLTLCE